ncbi:DUF1365 domain-containing protein [Pseudacidovorax intermedius]|uniref:DUF1365 domain-containing protein n=1 Tax=Pseudacidovorax intermedius TaxID=433924 RepID=A0A147GNT8_9BURK|nr:DUF1365 family protein [Pseudacidovorax intermedius]KTT15792.1 hypothetical protein NS331_19750 [Pseudacidovorax intermedius]
MSGDGQALYSGRVMHQRMRPRRHRLAYRVYSLLLDIDRVEALSQRSRLFSLGRFNLFSLRWCDYGAGDAEGPRAHVEAQLIAAGLPVGGRIRLLTMPRILGYAFNPLSVYFCDAPGGGLRAILYEVNNTFGQRHSYLLPVEPGTGERVEQRCDKALYVSPFMGLDMHYRFRIRPPAADAPAHSPLSVGVDAVDAQGPLLVARLDATARPLDDRALLAAFVSHPLLTLKVIGAIHWEALRLWLKGVGLVPRPAPPGHAVSIHNAGPAPASAGPSATLPPTTP